METQRLWQALQLKRDAYVWMQFNQAANGDAVIVVGFVYAVWVAVVFFLSVSGLPVVRAGILSVTAFITLFIRGGFGWILGSGAVWLIVSYVFEQPIRFGSVIPITGYAHAPLALVPGPLWFLLSQDPAADRPLGRLLLPAQARTSFFSPQR